jgi:hypothetical protein
VLSCGLNSLDVIVESKVYLRVGVIFVEMVVVEAPILECADLLRDHLLPDGQVPNSVVASSLALQQDALEKIQTLELYGQITFGRVVSYSRNITTFAAVIGKAGMVVHSGSLAWSCI